MVHVPVLLNEAIESLSIKVNGIYVDGTFGRGGHSAEILKHLGSNGRLLAIDKDPTAVTAAKTSKLSEDPRFTIEQGSFSTLLEKVSLQGWVGKVDGILLDIGVSSPQLDDSERGFSFLKEGPLDMRMDTSQTLDATWWINHTPLEEMANIFFEYGEERYSQRIAKAIILARELAPITTTTQLAEIVAKAHPRWERHKHPATRVFQAIRIAVNHELEELETTLEQSLEVLAKGGRLSVITFHSLEDQVVKRFYQKYGTTAAVPKGLAIPQAELEAQLRIKRIAAIKPSQMEIKVNPRARSATLRIMEKLQ